MKTALAELIEIINKQKKNKGSLYGFTFTKKLQKQLLAKERQDLIDAHAEGQIFIVEIIKECLPEIDLSETFQEIEKHKSGNDNDETAEKYVKEKFGI